LGLGTTIFPMIFNDTYQMIKSVLTFQARKIDKKCKNVLNFHTVTLWVLCSYMYVYIGHCTSIQQISQKSVALNITATLYIKSVVPSVSMCILRVFCELELKVHLFLFVVRCIEIAAFYFSPVWTEITIQLLSACACSCTQIVDL
jgi:hypothetical protein